jgi:hypothetical protein
VGNSSLLDQVGIAVGDLEAHLVVGCSVLYMLERKVGIVMMCMLDELKLYS